MRSSKTKSPIDSARLFSDVNNSEIGEENYTTEEEAISQGNISISEIRKMYDAFKRLSIFPFVDITVFCHIVPFRRISSNFMFNEFCKNNCI